MDPIHRQVFSAFFFYACISLTLALGLAAIVSGIAANLNGQLINGIINYFVGFISLFTAHWVYFKGKKILLYH